MLLIQDRATHASPPPAPTLRCVNLGCGQRYRDGWINIDFASPGPDVIAHDLRTGIPLPDEDADLVYHSHVLEHFTPDGAMAFLRECRRILRPGGIIRVAVPDLEAIARAYLHALERAAAGAAGWDHNYDWMVLELLDQMVRTESGGQTKKYLASDSLPNRPFIIGRWGVEASRLLDQLARHRTSNLTPSRRPKPLALRLREALLRWLLGGEYPLLQRARFRNRGEIHQWMYDRFSLARLLTQAGFERPRSFGPAESCFSGWADQHLDTCQDGTAYKPDSLYIEALKPKDPL